MAGFHLELEMKDKQPAKKNDDENNDDQDNDDNDKNRDFMKYFRPLVLTYFRLDATQLSCRSDGLVHYGKEGATVCWAVVVVFLSKDGNEVPEERGNIIIWVESFLKQ